MMDLLPMVRALKGCPISCLLIMIIVHQPVSAEYLVVATGYTDKPVTLALKILSEYQLITRVTGGWMLSQAVQLQLPVDSTAHPVEENRNNSDNSLSCSSSSAIEETDKSTTTTTKKDRNNSDNRKNSDILTACHASGIRPPKSKEIATLPHVTPELIKYHVNHSESIALAIYRIINNWPIPSGENSRQKYVEGEFSDHIQH